MVERPVSGSSAGRFLLLVKVSYKHQLSRISCYLVPPLLKDCSNRQQS